jgi:LPS-assembly protein
MVQMSFFNLLQLFCCLLMPSFLSAQTSSAGKSSTALATSAGPVAKVQGLMLQADNLMRDHEKEVIELQGNVQIVRGDQHILCQRAVIYLRSKKMELFGEVSVVSSTQTLTGDEIFLDYETATGIIKNGYIKSGHVLFEGDLIQKTGPDEFYVTDANYTSCTNCPSTWSFSGKQIRAELGGYAYIKNSVMRIGGVPILWLPYLVVPLKSDRQTGLLTPTFGYTKAGGSEFAQPYFWAVDRSRDMTITAKNFEKRKLMGMANYRYVLSENSKGELDTALINDEVFTKPDSNFKKFHPDKTGFNRWYLYYQHYLELDDGWIQRMTLHNASDLRYMRDFEKETSERNLSDPALENRVSFSKNWDKYHFTFDSSYYVNLLRTDPLANNNDAVHRLPELSFSQTPETIFNSPFLFSFDLNYVNFARSFKGYDDLTEITLEDGKTKVKVPTNSLGDTTNAALCDDDTHCVYKYDGKYDEASDLIRTGQRIDFKPTVNANFRIADSLDIIPRITYRDTHYFFPVGEDSEVSRRYLKTELTSKLTMSRIFGDDIPQASRYKHVIEPEISYSNVPWFEFQDHPFFPKQSSVSPSFGNATPVSDGDLTGPLGIQYDQNDRILDRNLITLGITNRLIQRLWGGTSNEYRQVARFKLSQSYNLTSEATRDGQNRWSDLAGVLTVKFDNIETSTNFNYFPDQNVTNFKTRTALINDHGQFFEVGLDRTYTIVQGQPVIKSNRVEDISFGLGFTSSHLSFAGQLVYDANWKNALKEAQIKSWGYVAQLKPPGECWQINFTHGQKVGGDTRIDVGFEYNFDGVPKPPPPRSTLDQFRTN